MMTFKEWKNSIESSIKEEVSEWRYKWGERKFRYNDDYVWVDSHRTSSGSGFRGYLGDEHALYFRPTFYWNMNSDLPNAELRVSIALLAIYDDDEPALYYELESAQWAIDNTPYSDRADALTRGIKVPYSLVFSSLGQEREVMEYEFQHVLLERLLKQMKKPSRNYIEQKILDCTISEEERDRMVLLTEILNRYPLVETE